MIMTEIVFVAEQAIEGGYVARAVGSSVVTEADDIASLHDALRDAVRCHFEDADRPNVIRLHQNAAQSPRSEVRLTFPHDT